jgi:hypothetical protein
MITIGDQPKRPIPARIERLFAAAHIAIPAHGTVAMEKVDAALKTLSLDERFYWKSRLHELGIIGR